MKRYVFPVWLLLWAVPAFGQIDDSIAAIIMLDSDLVVAAKRDFDVRDFIRVVRQDTVFEQSFKRLRRVSYHNTNAFRFFARKRKKVKATYESEVQQRREGYCTDLEVISEKTTGNFYTRRGQYRYYTAKMFARLFLRKGRHCVRPDRAGEQAKKTSSRMEKYVAQLKKLIFNPGRPVDIPLIGHKTAIFDEKMLRYYDFKILSRPYQDGTACYVFSARAKPGFPSGKTVIKSLEMWLRKSDYGIIAKKYHLRNRNLLFWFDVRMDVALTDTPAGTVPARIDYDGAWKVPGSRPEIAAFHLRFDYPDDGSSAGHE